MKPSNYSHFVEIARQRAVEHPERDCIIFLEDGIMLLCYAPSDLLLLRFIKVTLVIVCISLGLIVPLYITMEWPFQCKKFVATTGFRWTEFLKIYRAS